MQEKNIQHLFFQCPLYFPKCRWRLGERLMGLILIITFYSCGIEERIDWEMEGSDADFIVVEGMLTNKVNGVRLDTIVTSHYVRLSHPVTDLNGFPEPISGADVTIYSDQKNYELFEYQNGSGLYLSDSMITGNIGTTYHLRVRYKGENYSASTSMVPLRHYNFMSYQRDEDDTESFYMSGVFDYSGSAMLQVNLDWSHTRSHYLLPDSLQKARMLFFALENFDINHQLKPDQQKVKFPEGTRMEQRIYALGPDYADFYRSLLIETVWRGSVFDVYQSNVRSNLSDGAMGYFGAATVQVMDTVIY